ncbi:MAG: winged helix-turn-helix domain-containing protein [Pseudomonas sp.]
MDAVAKHGSQRKAAIALDINVRTLERRLQKMVLRGYSPEHDMTRTAPPGFGVKGTSTLYNKHGELTQQWVKTMRDPAAIQAMMEEILEGLREEIPREAPFLPAPKSTDKNLCNLYVITDYHMGMLAWGEETRGEDWDLQIAENMLVAWFKQAILESPEASVGILGQLGDFLHWDGWAAVTPTSGHLLDADGRFPKLVRVTLRALRRVIAMMLQKHSRVHIIMAEGNHDLTSSVWLQEVMALLYADDYRVTVDTSPDPYYCYEWGKSLLLFHHGHKRKPNNIDSVFVGKFRVEFGRTEFAYAHMGHQHHIDQKETNLMVVEQHRTLASSDAYASKGGWQSGQDACVITYHKDFGERFRSRIPASMLKERK